MIPKIIHYCWFGRGEKPELAKKCIASWKKFCPDFEIREWNEDNCDYLSIPFMAEAYAARKYAFVSDVMRLLVLEQQGGVYFDTDVEVVRDITPLLNEDGFIGFENDRYVASGLAIAATSHHPVITAMIEEYRKLHFTNTDGTTNPVGCPRLNTHVMEQFGLVRNGREQTVAGIHVYPADFFNPLDSATGKLTKTENTYSIHWYSMSWLPWHVQARVKVGRIYRRIKKAMRQKITAALLLLLFVFGCLGCILTLTDYFAPTFSKTEGSAVLNIETYIDGQNQPTHPTVIDLQQEWHGFRYWMSYSPYPNANGAEENPCIGVSNDMVHWTTPEGLYNPIAFNEETACDELKDPHILYNSDLNRMEIWYLGRVNSTIKSSGTLLLFRKVSSDGVHWSEYEIMRDLSGYLSPSIIYSEGKYKLWAIQPSTSTDAGALAYSESVDGTIWTTFEACTLGNQSRIEAIWHGAVSLDNRYRFVFIEDSGKSDTVLYTESSDGITWDIPVSIIQKDNFWNAFYRPCIIYSDNCFYCIYGVITQNNEWYLSMSTGDAVDDLHGISVQDVGNSKENMALSETLTFGNLVKDVYHFIHALCRPEMLLICIAVTIILLAFKKYSFALLWGCSWVLGVLRFYSWFRGISLSEKFLLLFTVGMISLLFSLTEKQSICYLEAKKERAR